MCTCKQFFDIEKQDIGDVIIFSCFDILHILKKKFRTNIVQEFERYYKGLTIQICNTKITVIVTGSGDARVGDAVLAVRDCEIKGMIYTGTAGGLCEESNRGDVFVTDEAISGDGFSRYYKKMSNNSFDNTVGSSKVMLKCFQEFHQASWNRRLKVRYGKIFTIDSVFAETNEFLNDMVNYGCAAIDMETAAFYTAAQVSSKNGIAIHYISDLPRKETNYDMFRKECLRTYLLLPELLISFASYYAEKY